MALEFNINRDDWAWQDHGLCRGESLYLFFGADHERGPAKDTREAKAKRICGSCPVRRACLDHAVTQPERAGVWGGKDQDELVAERRRRNPSRNRDFGKGICAYCECRWGLTKAGLLISHPVRSTGEPCLGRGSLPKPEDAAEEAKAS